VSNTQPASNSARSFLAQDEEPQLEWQGKLIQGEDEEIPAKFVATDNRLLLSYGSGHFKDIGLKHVESVEVATDTETEVDGNDPDGIIALGVVSGIVGIGAMIFGGFSATSVLVGLALIGFGGYGVWWGKDNYDRLKEDLDVTEYEIFHIIVRTDATSPFSMPIYIETRDNVGPDLSRLVQESKNEVS
jgi:hypothetical protein